MSMSSQPVTSTTSTSSPHLLEPLFNLDAIKVEVPSSHPSPTDLMNSMTIDLTQIESTTPEERALVDELSAHLPQDYEAPHDHGLSPDLYKPVFFNWPNRLTPSIGEIDSMFTSSYWLRPPTPCSEQILTEEHQTVINHLVCHYKQSMQQTELAHAAMRRDLEVFTIVCCSWLSAFIAGFFSAAVEGPIATA
jgi:hypothetical protein